MILIAKQNNRKNEHVSLAQKFYPEKVSPMQDIHFVHHSLPQTMTESVDLSTKLAGLSFSSPFFINAMTGGSEWTQSVNEKLAIIARDCNLAMATGSVSAGLKNPSVQSSYQIVRQLNPDNIVMANLGAGHDLENAKRAVDLLQADVLQIHVNAPQEIVMPEGDRDFTHWINNIKSIVEGLDIPVIIKEVGFGMSRETIQTLESIGVNYIDVSGSGGTNFAQIENYRRKNYKLDDFESLGQSTAVSLLEANSVKQESTLIASGGIRTPMDIAKALALEAKLVGLSSQFLHMAIDNLDQAITTVENWKSELRKLYTILGAQQTSDLAQATDIVITGQTADWCQARQIGISHYANRTSKLKE